MGALEGKVAFITGAGRGQGRSHGVRLAADGADIIALDLCEDAVETIGDPLATRDDLDETVALVEAEGRKAVKGIADVRNLAQVQAVVDQGVAELGASPKTSRRPSPGCVRTRRATSPASRSRSTPATRPGRARRRHDR